MVIITVNFIFWSFEDKFFSRKSCLVNVMKQYIVDALHEDDNDKDLVKMYGSIQEQQHDQQFEHLCTLFV